MIRTAKKKTTNLVSFTEEILNGKLHFLCSVECNITVTRVTSGYAFCMQSCSRYLRNVQKFGTVSIHHK